MENSKLENKTEHNVIREEYLEFLDKLCIIKDFNSNMNDIKLKDLKLKLKETHPIIEELYLKSDILYDKLSNNKETMKLNEKEVETMKITLLKKKDELKDTIMNIVLKERDICKRYSLSLETDPKKSNQSNKSISKVYNSNQIEVDNLKYLEEEALKIENIYKGNDKIKEKNNENEHRKTALYDVESKGTPSPSIFFVRNKSKDDFEVSRVFLLFLYVIIILSIVYMIIFFIMLFI